MTRPTSVRIRRDRPRSGTFLPSAIDSERPLSIKASPGIRRLAARWWWAAVIVVACVAAYSNSLSVPFVFDDRPTVTNNPHIERLWPLWEALSAPKESPAAGRPLVCLSLAVNYALGGRDPVGYHVFNLAVHVLAALALFGVVRRTLQGGRLGATFGKAASSLALAATLLWSLHPLQTESVTYVGQRPESLVGLFYLLAFYCAIRASSASPAWKWEAGAVAAAALAMLSKEVAATLPVMLVLYDWAFLPGAFEQVFRRRLRLYGFLAATWLILAGLIMTAPRGATTGFHFADLSAWDYARTQCNAVARYLKLTFWPRGLVLDYGDLTGGGLRIARSLADCAPSAVLLGGLLALTAAAMRFGKEWGFLGLWFFGVLAPSSSIVPIATEIAAEHRMYLPLAAVVVLVVVGGYVSAERLLTRLRQWGPVPRWALGGVALVLASALFCLTWLRNEDYRSAVSIWTGAVEQFPSNYRAHGNLGTAFAGEGKYDAALQEFNEALRLKPDDLDARGNAGAALLATGRYKEAMDQLSAVLKVDPGNARARYNLGLAYMRVSLFHEAGRQFEEVPPGDPNYLDARKNLGRALALVGRYDEAVSQFELVLRASPGYPGVRELEEEARARSRGGR